MIIIVGGGIIGLTMAALLAKDNFDVTLVEGNAPVLQWDETDIDSRVSAIHLASQRILHRLGVWEKLPANSYSALRRMEVWDDVGHGEIIFDSFDIGKAQLGFIVENRALIKALWEFLQDSPQVKLLYPHRSQQMTHSQSCIQLMLDQGQIIEGDLLIGADGADSWVRAQMAVGYQERYYQQHALVCVVDSENAHQHTAYQNFLPNGPIAFLPLSQSNRGAIVWSTESAEAQLLLTLPPKVLNYRLSEVLGDRLGQLEVCNSPRIFPLIMRHAQHYVAPHVALIGDAAHSIHPLAGQGANLGLLDAACLTQVISEARQKKQDLGSYQVLRRYERWRKGENQVMQKTMTGFNYLFGNQFPWIVAARSHGLNAVNQLGLLKNAMMKYATGERGELPTFAK